jgi:hypothetical protein
MQHLVFFFQGFVIRCGGMSTAGLVVGALDFSQPTFQHQASATLTFVSFVDGADGTEQ